MREKRKKTRERQKEKERRKEGEKKREREDTLSWIEGLTEQKRERDRERERQRPREQSKRAREREVERERFACRESDFSAVLSGDSTKIRSCLLLLCVVMLCASVGEDGVKW